MNTQPLITDSSTHHPPNNPVSTLPGAAPLTASAGATRVPAHQESLWDAVLGALVAIGLGAAGFAIGAGVTGLAGDTQSYWYLSRAAGYVAYLLLWGSVVWGLLLTTKVGRGRLRAPALFDAHQFLSNVALGFALFHGLILLGDSYLGLRLAAIVVPFASGYETLLVAAGQLGLWLSGLLVASFYARKRIGQRRWRTFHYASFAAYALALLHAMALTTANTPLLVKWLYPVTAGVVILLMLSPLAGLRQRPAAPRQTLEPGLDL